VKKIIITRYKTAVLYLVPISDIIKKGGAEIGEI